MKEVERVFLENEKEHEAIVSTLIEVSIEIENHFYLFETERIF